MQDFNRAVLIQGYSDVAVPVKNMKELREEFNLADGAMPNAQERPVFDSALTNAGYTTLQIAEYYESLSKPQSSRKPKTVVVKVAKMYKQDAVEDMYRAFYNITLIGQNIDWVEFCDSILPHDAVTFERMEKATYINRGVTELNYGAISNAVTGKRTVKITLPASIVRKMNLKEGQVITLAFEAGLKGDAISGTDNVREHSQIVLNFDKSKIRAKSTTNAELLREHALEVASLKEGDYDEDTETIMLEILQDELTDARKALKAEQGEIRTFASFTSSSNEAFTM